MTDTEKLNLIYDIVCDGIEFSKSEETTIYMSCIARIIEFGAKDTPE